MTWWHWIKTWQRWRNICFILNFLWGAWFKHESCLNMSAMPISLLYKMQITKLICNCINMFLGTAACLKNHFIRKVTFNNYLRWKLSIVSAPSTRDRHFAVFSHPFERFMGVQPLSAHHDCKLIFFTSKLNNQFKV